jgi:peptidyl-prolyl cis-trans isomerase B (cyclophilin B)
VATRKQTKRELKLQKQAAREAARRAERRRALVTAGIVTAVIVLGAGLIALTLISERNAAAEEGRQAAEAASEAAAAASEEAKALADRKVACGAEAPEGTGKPKPTFEQPEDVVAEGIAYQAVIETSCGRIVLDLDAARAPETVNSFVFLAQQGFFDGLEIFRNATSIGALQTGSGSNESAWQLGYTIPDELEAAEQDGYPPGAVAMASQGPDTSGSQFFFVYNDKFTLDPAYTRFATVTEGLDVLERIGSIPPIGAEGESPSELVYLNRVEIIQAESSAPSTPVPEASE